MCAFTFFNQEDTLQFLIDEARGSSTELLAQHYSDAIALKGKVVKLSAYNICTDWVLLNVSHLHRYIALAHSRLLIYSMCTQ